MIADALAELAQSAADDLPRAIAAVEADHGIVLTDSFAVEQWCAYELELNRATYPVLAVLWDGESTIGLVNSFSGTRDTTHQMRLLWVFRSQDQPTIARHVQYLPEALLRWLDAFPIATRRAGVSIQAIAPPNGQGVQLKYEILQAREVDGVTTYTVGISASFPVQTIDVIP